MKWRIETPRMEAASKAAYAAARRQAKGKMKADHPLMDAWPPWAKLSDDRRDQVRRVVRAAVHAYTNAGSA